ncbi:hypothetical protein [Absidia glauca]|uniref:tRNA-splicing endonuclease subunit Sen54 N-terminal domain-containing protein n=1 Tax=Absidia glauca TaxID=4829 RepID=A0A168NT80_ABSGL|nr:hypothetical protein [Absidia glauca]
MNDADDIDEVADFSTLLNKSKKRGEAGGPKRGNKTFAPDDSSTQQTALEQSRGALWDLIGEVKPLAGQHSIGVLSNDSGLWTTTITQKKGTYYQFIGHSNQGNMTLYLEEAAWLMNRHALSVHSQGGLLQSGTNDSQTPVNFEDYCALMFGSMDGWITFERYQVYAYLKRLGYIVQRSSVHTHSANTERERNGLGVLSRLYQRAMIFVRAIIRSMATLSIRPLVTHYQCKGYGKTEKGNHCSYLNTDYLMTLQSSPIIGDVYSSLRTISFNPWHMRSQHFDTSSQQHQHPYTIAWDVYKPNPKWKKRDPGVPDFRVVVGNMHDSIPSPDNLNYLFSLLYGLPYKENAYHPIQNTQSLQSQPALLMGLVGDSEGVTFIRLQSDGVADIT